MTSNMVIITTHFWIVNRHF